MVPTVTDPPGQLACIGADISTGLTAICGERGLNALTADGLAVPLRSGAADAAVSIAVLHHLSTAERRAAAVGEVLRVLRPGGTFMIQAWAKEQGADSKRTFEAQDVMVPWKFRTAYLTQAPAFPGGPRPEPGQEAPVAGMAEAWGGSVDAEADRVVFQRYCHVYVEGELAELVAATPGATVTKAWWERGNWCVTGVRDSAVASMG
ncbi:alkbh8 [Symbiodinium sp. KB8]|nr:alkbh8 [Symbiodinium sp. KB8]